MPLSHTYRERERKRGEGYPGAIRSAVFSPEPIRNRCEDKARLWPVSQLPRARKIYVCGLFPECARVISCCARRREQQACD